MKRIKLVVDNLTSEGHFRNREDVADEFAGHVGDVFLMICRLNALIKFWFLPTSLILVVEVAVERWVGVNGDILKGWCTVCFAKCPQGTLFLSGWFAPRDLAYQDFSPTRTP